MRIIRHNVRIDADRAPFHARGGRNRRRGNERQGKGNGGKLNLLDRMAYATAKHTARPVLRTGRDFADTDAAIHPASRRD